MSDLEYDSADSSQDAAMEQSALETAEAAGERGSAKDPTVESLNEGQSPVSPESTGEDEEEEEDSGAEASEAGEEQTEAVAGAGGEQEDGESSGEDATAADTLTESAREAASKTVKASGFLDSSDDESGNEDEWKAGEEERHTERGTEEAGGGASELGEGEEGGSEGVKDAAKVPGGRKFLEDSEDEEDETNATRDTAEDDKEQEKSVNESISQEEVFGASDDDEGDGNSARKRSRRSASAGEGESDDEEREGAEAKRLKEGSEEEVSASEGQPEGEESEREGEGEGEGEGEEGGEGEGSEETIPELGGERVVGGEREDEEDPEDPGPSNSGMSDWDIMMQRRKEAMARARKRRKRDIDITAVDDHIMAMIREMRQAVEEDRQLNQARQPALKKLKMLPTVMLNLKKSDLQTSFIECGILTVLSEWLNPLPDRSLPHIKIRESILDVLKSFPVPESHILKSSRIGKAVMLLYRHPKETRKNKEKAGKIINEWARPIFGLASDFKSLGRDEREERDYANLSQANRRRLSSSSDPSKRATQEEEYEPAKPGDKGWIGRARVPMPSTRDYVVRPKWKVEQEFKRGPSKKVMNRYEKQMNKEKQRKMRGKASHAVAISVEGRKMPL